MGFLASRAIRGRVSPAMVAVRFGFAVMWGIPPN